MQQPGARHFARQSVQQAKDTRLAEQEGESSRPGRVSRRGSDDFEIEIEIALPHSLGGAGISHLKAIAECRDEAEPWDLSVGRFQT